MQTIEQITMNNETINTSSTKDTSATDDLSITTMEEGLTSKSLEMLGSARNTLFATVFLLLGDIMGTGVLSLPSSASKLGWICTIFALIVFAFTAYYSGVLLSKVKQQYPAVHSYSDAAYALNGPIFGMITKVCILLNWGALLIYFVIATVNSISMITDQYGGIMDCQWKKSIIACFLLIMPVQCRDYHTISYLAIPSTIAMIFVVIVVLEDISTKNNQFGTNTTTGVDPNLSFLELFSSFSSFVFAYQGQSIYFELMTEMKEPQRFPKSCMYAYFVMWLVYLITVIVAYGYGGSDVPGFLPDAMSNGPLKVVTAIFIIFHVLVAYVVTGQPLHHFLHSKMFPKTLDKSTVRGTIDWFIVTGSYLVFAFIISNAIPFFSDIQNLIGSVFGAPIVFGWPVIFYVSMCYHEVKGSFKLIFKSMGYWHVIFCGIFAFILLPLFCIVGTVSALSVLINDIKDSGQPFSC